LGSTGGEPEVAMPLMYLPLIIFSATLELLLDSSRSGRK
jgi:hypothetical protein